jgi:hypothetical protein
LKKDNVKADLIYVDAGHTFEEAYADMLAYYKLLKGPKILCGDDYTWVGVKQAVDTFAKDVNLVPIVLGPFWAFLLEDSHLNTNIRKEDL